MDYIFLCDGLHLRGGLHLILEKCFVLKCEFEQFIVTGEFQFSGDVHTVVLHGAGTDEERFGDLCARLIL